MASETRYLFVCTNKMPSDHPLGCCHDRGSREIIKRLEEVLATRGLAETVRVSNSGCFAKCENGPNMVVYPDGVWYGHVAPDDIDEIVVRHLIDGEPVERLKLEDTGGFI